MNVVTNEVGVRALRLELSRYLAAVQQGREVLVTEHGKPIARLIPVEASSRRLAHLIEQGEVEAAPVPKDDWSPARLELPSDMTVEEIVAEQRR